MRRSCENTKGRVVYAENYSIMECDGQEEALRWLTARGTKKAGDNKKWQAAVLAFLAGSRVRV